MVPLDEAERAHAENLCAELNRQIGALDRKAERLRSALAKYVAEKRGPQIKRVQSGLAAVAVERRALIDMLAELGHSHPCDSHRPD